MRVSRVLSDISNDIVHILNIICKLSYRVMHETVWMATCNISAQLWSCSEIHLWMKKCC